jgi:type IV pilus assembly protein PilC
MLFNYKAIDKAGDTKEGVIDAINRDVAISSLQKRDLIISSIVAQDDQQSFMKRIPLFNRISNKEVVILSRQLATLFEAQVSALRIFKLMSAEIENDALRKSLTEIADDLQGGSSISKALAKHPNVFSTFYVNLVKAGEESGRLDETFNYLADYLDRTYEVSSKAKNALIYPAFVIATFIGVMILMFTVIIPKISSILTDSGQQLPIYTRIVLGVSGFFVHYGIFLLVAIVIGGFALWRFASTPQGQLSIGSFKLSVPYVGDLYKKLYLSRIADNMNTMIISGIPMLHALEITANVVGNEIYREILEQSLIAVKGGSSLSASLAQYPEIPGIMVQMVKVGEETGQLGKILKTLANFYQREVINAVDTLVGLIEPVMIVVLGLGVGILLASVLMPIYNVASTFGS